MANYSFRAALPHEAEEILQLVATDFERVGFLKPPAPTEEEIAGLEDKISTDTIMRRVVALGDEGIAAYAKIGPWDKGGYVHAFGNPLQRVMGGSHATGTGLYTLAVRADGPQRYRGQAVETLVEGAGLFDAQTSPWKVPVAGIDFPEMRPFTDLLRYHGVTGTGLFGHVAVAGISAQVRSELWSKTRPN